MTYFWACLVVWKANRPPYCSVTRGNSCFCEYGVKYDVSHTHVLRFKVQQTVEMSKQEEASKAVVQRCQEGAIVSASSSSVRKKPPKTALDEDEFTDVRCQTHLGLCHS